MHLSTFGNESVNNAKYMTDIIDTFTHNTHTHTHTYTTHTHTYTHIYTHTYTHCDHKMLTASAFRG